MFLVQKHTHVFLFLFGLGKVISTNRDSPNLEEIIQYSTQYLPTQVLREFGCEFGITVEDHRTGVGLASRNLLTLREMCKIIDGLPKGASKLSRAFAAASLYYNYTQTEKCFNLEGGTDAHGLHGWDWQACTEMVMPMTCSNESMFPPFSFSYKEFKQDCKKNYGVEPRPHWITTEFGGYRIEQVLKRFGSNMIFSNGMQDPWSRGGVLKNISASIVALVTQKGAHHVDFRSETKNDPDWLIMQRKQEMAIIQKWLEEYYRDIKQN